MPTLAERTGQQDEDEDGPEGERDCFDLHVEDGAAADAEDDPLDAGTLLDEPGTTDGSALDDAPDEKLPVGPESLAAPGTPDVPSSLEDEASDDGLDAPVDLEEFVDTGDDEDDEPGRFDFESVDAPDAESSESAVEDGPLDLGLEVELDDTAVPRGTPWSIEAVAAPNLAGNAVLAREGELFYAGSAIAHRDARRPWEQYALGAFGSAASIAFTDGHALVATRFGALLRVERDAEGLAVSPAGRFDAGSGAAPPRLAACSSGCLLLSSGRLLRVDPGGDLAEPVVLPGAPAYLASNGADAYVLGSTSAGARLWKILDAGESPSELELPRAAAMLAGGETPELAAAGSVIAIAEPERGLALSSDGGRSFRSVPGCAGITALAAGQDVVWAALYSEVRAEATLISIDVRSASACAVGTLTTPESSSESTRIFALCFDETTRELYALSDAGLFRATA